MQTEEDVKNQLAMWNYCEIDEDCSAFYAPCPFGCRDVVNKEFVEVATELIATYRNQQATLGAVQCEYDCMSVENATIQCETIETQQAGKCTISWG